MALSQQELTQSINDALAQLTDDIKNQRLDIPSPPSLLVKLRAVTSDSNSNAQDIVDVVKLDPNISGRLLKVSNSTLFGARVHTTSVQGAVTRLGAKTVQNLVTSLLITQNFMQAKTKGLESHCNNAWQHSNEVAAIAYSLARKKTSLDPEQALLAGMTHNIGVLPIILRLSTIPSFKDKPELLSHVADIVIPKLYLGAGKLILDSWNFPPEFSKVSLTHQSFNSHSEEEVNLQEIIAIAYQLHKINDFSDNESEATTNEALVSSSLFNKLWSDWSEACSEINELLPEMSNLKQEMAQ